VARLRTGTATSAGGIVHRRGPAGRELVVGSRRRERVGISWSLPKGTPIEGETTEETALREVTEETGLAVVITGPLDSIAYSFVREGVRISKTVHYFLMEPTGGDFSAHDHEFEEVRWIPFAEAAAVLTFDSERGLVELAASRLEEPELPTA
jgi:8-oxo-dGTP pyrophosphatase MutT (NUDIX family)